MAGTVLLKQQQNTSSNNKLPNSGNKQSQSLRSAINRFKKATTEANAHCCLWLQQPQVVESKNNSQKIFKPMQHYTIDYCHSYSSPSKCSSTTDDRTLTTYNNNNNKNNNYKQTHPLTTSSIAAIIMSLILLIQMPTFAYGKSISAEASLASVSLDYSEADTSMDSQAQPEKPSKFILSLLTETGDQDISSSSLTSSSASLDVLTSLDVLRHMQRTREYQKERRMRLRKRHTGEFVITNYLQENSHNLEWKNPCNVDHVQTNIEMPRVNRQQVYQYLKKFEHDLSMEYDFINATATKININDIADWNKHDEVYKFLPKLMANGSIALSRWYRNMQVYVASFGYLARIQYKFDKKKQIFAGDTSHELNKLLLSARFILCELETTINGSAPNNNLKKLRTITRKAMNNRLNFVTKHQLANLGSTQVLAANTVDLKFAKYSYFQYLQQMHQILKHKLQNKGKKYGYVDYNNNNSEDISVNTVYVGDDSSTIDFNSIFKSDVSLSLGESTELLLKTNKRPQGHKRRQHKKKTA